MNIIKLDAIDSTNTFLKALSTDELTQNYTIVTAENQTNGRGQMGAKWDSEIGKNLIFSILIKGIVCQNKDVFTTNVAVAIAVAEALKKIEVPDISIKWPNDILSGDKKIAGILIENIFKSSGEIYTIIGIGLNVNQTNFTKLPKAASLKLICNKDFDKDFVLKTIYKYLMLNIEEIKKNNFDYLWEKYHYLLYKNGVKMTFKDNNNNCFQATIQGVSRFGKLILLTENQIIKEIEIKEIEMVY